MCTSSAPSLNAVLAESIATFPPPTTAIFPPFIIGYFTIDQKLKRFLGCCFTLYHVPQEKQDAVIGAVLAMELKPIAEKIIADTVARAEQGFEEIMAN